LEWRRTKKMRTAAAPHSSSATRIQRALLHFVQEVSHVETRFLNELNKKISELIAASPAKDVEKNVRALLSSAFARLDLVTREEFDVQQEVLGRTREKLQQMEARVAEMEKLLAAQVKP
jgi:BMFP domain-containing protein YqiC